MDKEIVFDQGDSYEELSRSSWTAFIRPLLLVSFVLLVFGSILWNLGAFKLFTAFAVVVLGAFTLKALSLNSRMLYIDETGIWLQRGIFPWTRGINGVKWRDLDEVLFSQGFFGWMASSHTVFVQHRFTKANELILPNMHQGDRAAMRINEVHHALIDPQGR